MASWLGGLVTFAIQEIAGPTLTKVGEALGERLAEKVYPNYSGLVREADEDKETEENEREGSSTTSGK